MPRTAINSQRSPPAATCDPHHRTPQASPAKRHHPQPRHDEKAETTAHAPGTGIPEAGGLTSRELLGILRGLAGKPLVGADVVEVSPAYDYAEMTTVAAAHVGLELLALMLLGRP
jgi:hypothetical protein